MSSVDGDQGDRPSREVAYRLFAAEFDDASFSYSESDEERAPNYVVTPTGARVNRLFAVGVLTEVEAVNDDVLRGRIVDPTGAFVSYAGQYQPDEMAFLDRASPPAFVALSGKARTFQPDDSDRVFTSVRPESMSRVDAATRDRWTVSTAEATLDRVGVMAAAIRSDLTGDRLRAALRSAGVDDALATGVPLALDHYGTTPAYLAALRQRAVEALEVVADERDSVRSLDVAPGETGMAEVSLAALAADLDLTGTPPASEPATGDATEAAAEPAGTSEPAGETTGNGADGPGASASATPDPETAAEAETAVEPDTGVGGEPEEIPTFEASEPEPTTADTASEPDEEAVTEGASEPASTETTAAAAGASTSEGTSAPETTSAPDDASTTDHAAAADDLGDFDTETATADAAESAATGADDSADDLGDFDAETATQDSEADADTDTDGMYELDESEREAVEEEFGTEFSTGSEVAPAGEADIDVPSAEKLDAGLDADERPTADAEETNANDATADTADTVDATDTADSPSVESADDEADASTEPAADVDLESAAVDAMAALDDGDGADREAVVARVVEAHGVDPADVEDAIQSALMSGQCYEPTEDSLKAI